MSLFLRRLIILVLVYFYNIGRGEVTRQLMMEDILVKPTTIRSSTDVETDEMFNDPTENFQTTEKSRRSENDIWDWDLWCQLQPKTGNCTLNQTRYYYDAQLDNCLTFTYSGCNGNKNQHETFVDCERNCKGAAFMPINNYTKAYACSLQPSAGVCLGYYIRYYYDVNEDKCKVFVYGGCGGNLNSFATSVQCRDECRTVLLARTNAKSSSDSLLDDSE